MADTEMNAAELPLDNAGTRLRRMREGAGVSRSDIAALTRIPERHLLSIEEGNFAALPARAYAVGFSRSYARAVGLDEDEIARLVRAELDGVDSGDSRQAPALEPGDPARVPSARLAWLAALAALAVIGAVLFFWRGYYFPAASLPSLAPEEQPAVKVVTPLPSPAPALVPVVTPSGAEALPTALPSVATPVAAPALTTRAHTSASPRPSRPAAGVQQGAAPAVRTFTTAFSSPGVTDSPAPPPPAPVVTSTVSN